MQALNSAAFLARLVLAWLVLAIGVAIAAPVVSPQGVELICSAGGVVQILVKGESGKTAVSHTLDCPLCVPSGAPPVASAGMTQAHPLRHFAPPIPAARIVAATHPVAPARGPPTPSAI